MGYDFEKERMEAVAAGNRALQSLRAAKSNLDSAKNWGIWDMLGGGFISSMVKRSKINNAKHDMEQAKNDLKSFSKELQDVSMVSHLNIETRDFLSFADCFFDGFVIDWMVQDRINNARAQVEEAIEKVEEIILELKNS